MAFLGEEYIWGSKENIYLSFSLSVIGLGLPDRWVSPGFTQYLPADWQQNSIYRGVNSSLKIA